jgi:uncharacterized protein
MAKSPSVTLIEKDNSGYATTSSSTILAIVGYATKGVLDTPTLVTSRTEFVEKFGKPSSSSPYGSLAAYRAFNYTNQIIFYRVAQISGDSTATYAEGVHFATDTSGDTVRVRLLSQEYGSQMNGAFISVSSRSNPIGDTYWDIYFYDGDSVLRETFSAISWNNGDTNFFETKMNADSSNGGSDWITVDTYTSTGDSVIQLAAGTYAIGTGTTAFVVATGDTWTSLFGDSFYNYRVGSNGIPSTGGDTLFTNALATTSDLANAELWNFHILATPDNGSEATQNAAISLAEYRKDFVYIADAPFGLTYSEAAEWHNGTGSHGRTAALNSSYAATYWPWMKDYDSVNGEYVWCPPSVWVAAKYLEVDNVYGPWYAPAGDIRGRVVASDIETSPSFAQREVLLGDLNAMNPIVNFNAKGLEIFGQKTTYRVNSALNRVNVRRMVVYAKKLIKTAMDSIVFEPHNAESWGRATNLINSILEPIRQGNGLSDYKVTIDDTTNTPDLIAQSTMKGIIQLVPTGTIEIINLTIQVNAAGSTIS